MTLTELVIVSAVVLVLSLLILSTITMIKTSAHQTLCANNLRQVGALLLTYPSENRGLLPYRSNNRYGIASAPVPYNNHPFWNTTWESVILQYLGVTINQTWLHMSDYLADAPLSVGSHYAPILKCPAFSAKSSANDGFYPRYNCSYGVNIDRTNHPILFPSPCTNLGSTPDPQARLASAQATWIMVGEIWGETKSISRTGTYLVGRASYGSGNSPAMAQTAIPDPNAGQLKNSFNNFPTHRTGLFSKPFTQASSTNVFFDGHVALLRNGYLEGQGWWLANGSEYF